jgi:hypothetical protein
MKNKPRTTPEKYLRSLKKYWDKHGIPSPAQQAEAGAKIKALIAGQRVKVAEAKELRANLDRVQDRLERFYRDVAMLAAQISPKAFNGSTDDMRAAIKLAVKRLRDTRRIIGEILQEDEDAEKKAAAQAEKAVFTKPRKGYQKAVRLITREKNWDRALGKWRRYIAATKVTPGSDLEKVLASYRERWEKHGWTFSELVTEVRGFDPWWKQEKGRRGTESAQSRAKRKTPGRLKRPASDLRLKENRRHAQGYCRLCGKPTRRHKVGDRVRYERLCDEHIKTKVLAFPVGSTDVAKLAEEKSPQRETTDPWRVLEGFSLE